MYGRYVDDFYVVSTDKAWLRSIIKKVRRFLKESLGLELHMGKVRICFVRQGVEFLGAFVKPYRTYLSNNTLRRVKECVSGINFSRNDKVFGTVNSYLGMMVHYNTYNLRRQLFFKRRFLDVAPFDNGMTKMIKNYSYE